ncbi:MAG TPA: TonB-dependent receptor [Polyangiaceae bacterium]|nr:TonB-dependent receptor [Polyangiaceae bacterium]
MRAARARRALAALALFGPQAARAQGEGDSSVTVEGTRTSSATRDSTVAATVVSGEELRAPGASAADVLARVPGVEVSRTGSSSDLATAAIRGATSAETPVYLAGVRLNDDVTGTADLSTLPLGALDRVEVYRGNAPLAADRLGIGGAVFFEPRFPRSTELSAGAGLGSFGERALWVTGAAASERAAALVTVRREAADQDYPFRDDRGVTHRRTNADYGATDAWSLARYSLGAGARVTTVLHAYDREQGSPGLAAVPNELARTRVRRFLAAATVRLPCGHDSEGTESCAVELVTSALAAKTVLSDPLTLLDSASLVASGGERFEEQARLSLAATSWLDLQGALSGARDRIAVERPGVTSLEASRTTLRPALAGTIHAGEHVEVTALGSVECEGTAGPGRSSSICDTAEPGARLGLLGRPSRALDVRANVGRYGRVPTLGELYGVSAVVVGNAALAPERGDVVDAGFHVRTRHRAGFSDFDAVGFYRSVEDLVAYRQTVPGVFAPYNVGRARVLGLELSAASDVWDLLGNTISMTLLDARDTTPGRTLANDILPFRSRLVFTDYTELHTKTGTRTLGVDRAALGFRVTHRSSRYADEGGLIVIPAQMTMDLEATALFLRRAIAARVSFRNILDAREVDTVGMPLPGRSVYGTLEATWR